MGMGRLRLWLPDDWFLQLSFCLASHSTIYIEKHYTVLCRLDPCPKLEFKYALGSPQPGALGFLQTVVPLVSVPNYFRTRS